VPFAKDCPFPNPVQQGMRFCSDPRYIGLLEDVGTDIVELTGDHFADWGAGAMRYTWSYTGNAAGGNIGAKPPSAAWRR
jgi:poly-gamma-glutamate synthesis protein (capsule biosynthesis protein)